MGRFAALTFVLGVIVHLLTCRIPILPGVGVPVWGLALVGEVTVVAAMVFYLIRRGNLWRLSWIADAAAVTW